MATAALQTTWTPHPGQAAIMADERRFRVVAAGRRWGKSEMCAHIVLKYGWENPDSHIWWVAPSYDLANEYGFDNIYPLLNETMLADEPKWGKPREITLVNGTTISFRSGDKMSSLRGPGLDLLVVDETAEVPRKAWTQELRPTLSDTLGKAVFIGTPQGRQLLFDLFQRGQAADHNEWASWQAPSYQNPHVADSEIDAAKADMADRDWRQEYLAEFISESGGVFTNIKQRNVEAYDWETYDGEAPYTHGWDLARHQNWTVGITLDATGRLVDYTRVQNVRWGQIRQAVIQQNERYPGVHQLDATRDEKVVEDLEDDGLQVEPVNFGASKATLIDNLVISMESGDIMLPDIDQLISELEVYEYDVTQAGNVRYRAPNNWHDDCVDALALANKEPERYRAGRATWGSGVTV